MADLPWWSWLGIGIFVAIASAFAQLKLFIWVGFIFIIIGIAKVVFVFVFSEKTSKKELEMMHSPKHKVVNCKQCTALIYTTDNFCRSCGLRIR